MGLQEQLAITWCPSLGHVTWSVRTFWSRLIWFTTFKSIQVLGLFFTRVSDISDSESVIRNGISHGRQCGDWWLVFGFGFGATWLMVVGRCCYHWANLLFFQKMEWSCFSFSNYPGQVLLDCPRGCEALLVLEVLSIWTSIDILGLVLLILCICSGFLWLNLAPWNAINYRRIRVLLG